MTTACTSTKGRRVFGPTAVHVECVECSHRFIDPDNVGNLPAHSARLG